MSVTLETLELTPQELGACKDAVQKMAYFNWLDAGSPADGQVEFWLKAEREWIAYNYVPHRTFDGARPRSKSAPPAVPAGKSFPEKEPRRAGRRSRAREQVQ